MGKNYQLFQMLILEQCVLLLSDARQFLVGFLSEDNKKIAASAA